MKKNPLRDFITFDELKAMCNVVRRTIYYWIDNGTAPKYERFGGRYYFYKTDALRKKRELDRQRKKRNAALLES